MPICVRDGYLSHTRTGYPIRVRDVPYAYGTIYAYWTEHRQATSDLLANGTLKDNEEALTQVTQGNVTNEDASNIGRELGENTVPITEELYPRSNNINVDRSPEEYETTVLEAAEELVDELFPSDSENQEPAITSTQRRIRPGIRHAMPLTV